MAQHFQGGFDFLFHGPGPLGVYRVSLGTWYQILMLRNGAILYNWIDFLVPIRFSDLLGETTNPLNKNRL